MKKNHLSSISYLKKSFFIFAIVVLVVSSFFINTRTIFADAPLCTFNDFSCDDWSACSPFDWPDTLVDGIKTRSCHQINCQGLKPGEVPPEQTESCLFATPTCTSWTYSDWSSCSSSGNQTRKIISSLPNNCVWGDPVLSQSCNYVPLCTSSDWSCTDWGTCSANSLKTRECNRTNCQGGVPSPTTSQSCTYVAPVPSCTSFNYSSWSSCSSSGNQTRNVTSKYPYNCEGGESPKINQSCTYTPSCAADTWTCGDWNSCSLSGVQNRSCRKTFDCPNVETAPPTTDQYCEAPNRPTQQVPQDSNEISNQDTIIKATVKLMCLLDENSGMQGSGTVIDPSGIILTNKHVVAGTLGCFVGFINNSDDAPYFGDRQIADIQKTSPNEDVAILKLRNPQNKKLTYIDIAKADSNLRLGIKINLYGYPAIFGTNMTYTDGTFSGVDSSYLKTTAIIEHGNSGGGAYLNNGMFVGIPSGVIKGELNALGYILSVNVINAWLGNSSIVYNGNSNQNNYSRVSSILENIDLKKLNSIELIVPGTKKSKEITNKTIQGSPTAPPSIIKKSTPNQTQKESTVIEPTKLPQTTGIVSNSGLLSNNSDQINNMKSRLETNTTIQVSPEPVKHKSLWARFWSWLGF